MEKMLRVVAVKCLPAPITNCALQNCYLSQQTTQKNSALSGKTHLQHSNVNSVSGHTPYSRDIVVAPLGQVDKVV